MTKEKSLIAETSQPLASVLGAPKDVTFIAAVDGSQQHYVEMLPPDFDPVQTHDVLIGLHGHGSDRWQYIREDRGECRGARDVAARHRLIFISPDYRATTSWMGPKAEADVVQIIQELRQKYKVNRVYLVGGSMGGSSVLTFTALHPDLVAGVSAQNPTANHLEYQNFQDAISASFGGTKLQIPEEYKKRSAEYWPERFIMPVAISTGGKDAVVPPQSAERFAAILKILERPVLLIHRENTSHESSYEDTVSCLEFVLTSAVKK